MAKIDELLGRRASVRFVVSLGALLLALSVCSMTCEGMAPMMSKLDLTHLRIRYSKVGLKKVLARQMTLQHLSLTNNDIDELALMRLLQSVEQLKSLTLRRYGGMTDDTLRKVCAACPRIEHLDVKREFLPSSCPYFSIKSRTLRKVNLC